MRCVLAPSVPVLVLLAACGEQPADGIAPALPVAPEDTP